MSFLLVRTRFAALLTRVTCGVPLTVTAKQVALSQTESAPSLSRSTTVTLVRAVSSRLGLGGLFADLAIFQLCPRTSPGSAALRMAVAGPGEGILERRAGRRCWKHPSGMISRRWMGILLPDSLLQPGVMLLQHRFANPTEV